MEVVRGVDRVDDVVVIGVLGIPIDDIEDPAIPDRETGDDFGAMSDKAGEPCKCACNGVDSVEGTVVPAGDVTTDELVEGGSLAGGEDAAKRC